MGIVGRIIQTGVVVTLHESPSGTSELGRSNMLAGSLFAETGEYAVNMQRVTIRVRNSGTARYFGVWVDSRLRSVGKLDRHIQCQQDDEPFFLPGRLRVEMSNG